MKTSRYLSLLFAVVIALGVNAQRLPFNGNFPDYTYRESKEKLMSQINACMDARKAPTKVLPIGPNLVDSRQWWTDGLFNFETEYNDEYNSINPTRGNFLNETDFQHFDFISGMLVKKGKVSVEDDPQARVNVEQIGGLVMLVERDKQNKPVRAFYQLPSDGQRNEDWVFFINYMFMGHYTTPDNLDVVFGPWMPCYSCHEYNVDPGIFGFNYDFDNRILHIIYGNSRVSHGDPSKFSKERMPGEGGAGAIMGPMQWDIIPTVSGLDVTIVHDEPFVDHFPRIGKEGDKVSLTHVESPFEGIPGRWAVASVIPLTHSLLQLFSLEELKLMRGEIFARYGDTFKDPATQRHFDAQPWYHRKGGRITVTAVERFNYDLITNVMATKPQ